jgi:acyl-CoA hydrolase
VPSIADTRFQMVQLVFPEHANPAGTLYGGRMMYWIATAGTLAASRFAHGLVVLGAMDDLDFLRPVHVGEIVTIDAQVECVGRTSMEVGVAVQSESPARSAPSPRRDVRRGEETGPRYTTSSHLAFIALDDRERPRPVGRSVTPVSAAERAVQDAAAARRVARLARVRSRTDERHDGAAAAGGVPPQATRLARAVVPEDAFSGTLMFAGQLLALLDEAAGITAARHARGPVVTASLDTVHFQNPIRVGEIADIAAAVTFVSRTSAEIGVRVDSERIDGARHHTCTAYLTMVHVDGAGRPSPRPPLPAADGDGRRARLAGAMRTRARKERVAALRAARNAH